MSTNVSNDKNASVQHRTKRETQLQYTVLDMLCTYIHTYIFGNLTLRTIWGFPEIVRNSRVEIKER